LDEEVSGLVTSGQRAGSLLSVNVGMPQDVSWQGKTVHTAVWKKPVAGPVMVRRLNIDDVGTLAAGPPSGLEPDAAAAADQDDGLPGQFGFALGVHCPEPPGLRDGLA
jgi:hypothetical protein